MSNIQIIPVTEINFSTIVFSCYKDLIDNDDIVHIELSVDKVQKKASIKTIGKDRKVSLDVIVGMDMVSLRNARSDKVERNRVVLALHGKGMIQKHIALLLSISQSLVSNIIHYGTC